MVSCAMRFCIVCAVLRATGAALRATPLAMQQVARSTTEASGSALLTATGLSLSYGERFLFNDISFTLAQGCKLALVGENGELRSGFTVLSPAL